MFSETHTGDHINGGGAFDGTEASIHPLEMRVFALIGGQVGKYLPDRAILSSSSDVLTSFSCSDVNKAQDSELRGYVQT